MKRMKKAGILASAIATTAICGSLVAGATFALFTDSDKVDITVSSGKVAVTAKVENVTVTNAKSITANGDTYTVDYTGVEATALETNGKSVSVANIIPADKVEFDIVLKNEGSVTANYQFSVNCVGGYELMRAFDVKIENKDTAAVVFDEVTAKAGETKEVKDYTSAWVKDFKKDNTATYHVTLSLPASTGNEAAAVTAKIEATVYAVQFNADVQNGENVEWFEQNEDGMWAYSVSSKQEFAAALEDGGAIMLTEDVALAKSDIDNATRIDVVKDMTIDLNGNEFNTNIDYIIKNGADVVIKNGTWDGTKLTKPETETFAVHGDVAGKQSTLTLENVDLTSGSYGVGIRNYTWIEKSEDMQPLVKVIGGSITTLDAYGCAFGTSAATCGNVSNMDIPVEWVNAHKNDPAYEGGIVEVEGTVINSNGGGIMLTVPVKMTLTNVTINSKMQCLVIRAGDVTLNNCTLNNNRYDKDGLIAMIKNGHGGFKYVNANYTLNIEGVADAKYYNAAEKKFYMVWGSSNDTELAAIVVGHNVNEAGTYPFDCKVTLDAATVSKTEQSGFGEEKVFLKYNDVRGHEVKLIIDGTDVTESNENVTVKSGSVEFVKG